MKSHSCLSTDDRIRIIDTPKAEGNLHKFSNSIPLISPNKNE